jgi:hypothetical protein
VFAYLTFGASLRNAAVENKELIVTAFSISPNSREMGHVVSTT